MLVDPTSTTKDQWESYAGALESGDSDRVNEVRVDEMHVSLLEAGTAVSTERATGIR